jgi:RNA polymerase sigma-70 factor, ECF subfamily
VTVSTAESAGRQDVHAAILREIPGLRRYAKFLVRDSDVADDLAQEALARAVAGAGSFRPGTNVRAWLFTILKNVVRNNFRRRRRNGAEAVDSAEIVLRGDPGDEPDAQLDLAMLADAIDTLPPSFRQVLMLCGVEGFLYEEAARVLDVPVGTVRSRLFRARGLLLRRLDGKSRTAGLHVKGRAIRSGSRLRRH